MKILTIMLLLVLASGCGSGNSGSVNITSVAPVDLTNFKGSYSLRSDSCEQIPPLKFNITQNANAAAFTITDNGQNQSVHNGEIFLADIIIQEGQTTYITSDSLGCGGFLIPTSDAATIEGNATNINVQVGDILLSCSGDQSQTGICEISYSRISY